MSGMTAPVCLSYESSTSVIAECGLNVKMATSRELVSILYAVIVSRCCIAACLSSGNQIHVVAS